MIANPVFEELLDLRLAIVRSMVGLAREAGMKLVFEGVETAGEVAALRTAGARYMQGYYFARPSFEAIVTDADVFDRPAGLTATGTVNDPNETARSHPAD